MSTARQIGSLGEVLLDQAIRKCCVDRLSWQRLPEKWIFQVSDYATYQALHSYEKLLEHEMLAILKDAAARPELFGWFGPIANHEIDSWLKQSNLRMPDDVRELWAVTGGGDFFDEGETLLRPTAVQSSEPYFIESTDFIDSVNQYCISNGMSTDYLLFHSGSFQSAIRLSDQRIVTLDSAFRLIEAFSHLDDWYLATLRHDYADVYGFRIS